MFARLVAFFSFRGRLSRREFLFIALPLMVGIDCLFGWGKQLLLECPLLSEQQVSPQDASLWLALYLLGYVLVSGYAFFCFLLKRLRDEGLSAWWLVPMFLVNGYVSYLWLPLCLLKSKAHEEGNQGDEVQDSEADGESRGRAAGRD